MTERFLQIDGLRIHCKESGEIESPRLLLIHGLGGSIESWEEIFDELSKSFHILAVDLPGCGQSDKPELQYTIDYFAEFICRFMESTGFQSSTLVGHSMGGMISIKTYLRCPEKVEALVLIDAAGLSETAAKKIREYMEDGWNMDRLKKFYRECVLGRLGELDETRLEESLRMLEDPGFRRAYFSSLNAISKPLSPEDLKAIKVPTLIIWGSDDKLTPLEDGIKLHQAVAGSRFVVIEGAGHSPHSEAPKQVVQEIRDFILKLKSR